MWTSCEVSGGRRDLEFEARLFEAEFRRPDVAKLVDIAGRALPAAVLSVETGGDLARSERYRTAHAPAGLGDEIRLLLVDGGVPWGCIHLTRALRTEPFSSADAEALAVLSAPLARAFRHTATWLGGDIAIIVERARPVDRAGWPTRPPRWGMTALGVFGDEAAGGVRERELEGIRSGTVCGWTTALWVSCFYCASSASDGVRRFLGEGNYARVVRGDGTNLALVYRACWRQATRVLVIRSHFAGAWCCALALVTASPSMVQS